MLVIQINDKLFFIRGGILHGLSIRKKVSEFINIDGSAAPLLLPLQQDRLV